MKVAISVTALVAVILSDFKCASFLVVKDILAWRG